MQNSYFPIALPLSDCTHLLFFSMLFFPPNRLFWRAALGSRQNLEAGTEIPYMLSTPPTHSLPRDQHPPPDWHMRAVEEPTLTHCDHPRPWVTFGFTLRVVQFTSWYKCVMNDMPTIRVYSRFTALRRCVPPRPPFLSPGPWQPLIFSLSS